MLLLPFASAGHIGIYRDNLLAIDAIKEDIAKMEKALATAGGPLAGALILHAYIKPERIC